MSVTIGNLTLRYGLMLAPMAGVTDRAFRRICVRHGAEYTVTEMVSAKALCFHDAKSRRLARLSEDELPAAVQLFGHEPDVIAEAIRLLLIPEDGFAAPPVFDLNMGCPMKKIVGAHDGAALMRDPALAARLIRAAAEASDRPVTVKIRTGWTKETVNAPLLARIAEENGAALIVVHGRTREQLYSPPVDLETIAAVKRVVSIPVVGNGGILTAEDALRMLSSTGCDGLMIARGAVGNPWLFEEIRAAMDGRSFRLPDLDVRLSEALDQVDEMIAEKGEKIGLLEARHQLGSYIRGVGGAAEARARLNRAISREEIHEIVSDFLKR